MTALFRRKKRVSCALDSHMHILPLSHICLSSYLSFVDKHRLEESYAVVSAPDYIFRDVAKNAKSVINILSVMENTPADMISLLEDDLKGVFAPAGTRPVMDENGLSAAGRHFDYLVITPLVMDFEIPDAVPDIYYSRHPVHSVHVQAADILEGIKKYYTDRPGGRLIVRPYMGVNPKYWTAEKLERMLDTHFGRWSPYAEDALALREKIPRLAVAAERPYAAAFAGGKVYPPLGFDPWPDDGSEREKLELIYDFCEKRGIPVITHCDDQGFRLIPLEQSFCWTSPERWEAVLRQYPDLYLDIAHFGKQYYKGFRFRKIASWEEKILELMLTYPHVYSDLSFTGTEPGIWKRLEKMTEAYPSEERGVLRARLLFGTDWPLCLSKTGSASDYWRTFLDSPMPDELKLRLVSENPRAFHFRDGRR